MDGAAAYRDRSIAVTGASGYIGSALMAALRSGGASPVAIDVRHPSAWRDIADHVDVIFHLAANTSARETSGNPEASYQATVRPITHLADALRTTGMRPRLIFASTATIYGSTARSPVDESAPPSPQTIYDLHKLWAEQQLAMMSGQGLIDATALRLSNVYGASPSPASKRDRGFLNGVVARAISGHDLCVYGDGRYTRDFVAIDDVVNALLTAGSRAGGPSAVCNVASGIGVPMREAVELVADRVGVVTGHRVAVRTIPWPAETAAIDQRSFTADVGRMHREYGWHPTVPLSAGIERMVAAIATAPVEEPPRSSIRLSLGSGGRPLAGYLNVDSDSLEAIRARYPDTPLGDDFTFARHDILSLPFTEGSVDEVRADSLIEHLGFNEERRFFEEAIRVLKPGGLLRLSTVDFDAAARQWLAADDDWRDFYRSDASAIRDQHWFGTYSYAANNRWGYQTATLFGNQNGAGQFHRNCYSEAKLRAICARFGLVVDSVERFRWQGDRDPMLALRARKAG